MVDEQTGLKRAVPPEPWNIGAVRTFPAQHAPSLEAAGAEPYENLHDLLDVLRRRWRTVGLCAAACLSLGVLACCVLTPKYTATAALEVNRDSGTAAGALPSEAGSLPEDVKTEVETDTSVLQSSGLALEVIGRLHLERSAPFSRVHVKAEAGQPLERAPKTRDAYLHLFGKALKVSSVPESRLVNVAFQSPDPAVAATAANTLAETFIADTLGRRLHSNETASFWIGRELTTLRDRVRDSEQALADFEHRTGLAGIDVQSSQSGGQSGLPTQAHNAVLDRLNALNGELTTAESNRISAETVYKLTESQDPEVVLGLGAMNAGAGGVSQAGGLELLRSLRSQQASLKLELADLETRFGPQNPRLVQLRSQATALEGELQAEMGRLRTRAENDFRYAASNEAALRGQLARQQKLADRFTDDAVQLQVLAQEALSNRTLYQSLYSQLNQANVAAGIHATRLDIVDRALVPGSPSSPNYLVLLAAALGFGVALGATLAFFQQTSDQSIRMARDVENTVHIPVISQLPVLPEAAGTANILDAPRSPFAEACRSLCTGVAGLLGSGSEPRVLLIGSPVSGDGKSTIAFNLAAAMAQRGERVLLIDGNLRHPGLRAFLPEADAGGLSAALTSGQPLAAHVSTHPHLPSLAILNAGRTPDLPAELFSSPEFDRLLGEARESYRWTVIDSPPMLPYTDAAIMAEKVDGVVAVLRSGVTSRDALKTYTQLLLRTRAPLLGFALNYVDSRMSPALQPSTDRSLQEGATLHA